VPTLTISGQIKFEASLASCPELGLRQLGDQEINIIDMARPVTKYAVSVLDPLTIRYHLERAVYLATHGRPGPVWIDIPQNVQSTLIDPDELRPYDEAEDRIGTDLAELERNVDLVVEKLHSAKRPLMLAGWGIRLAGGVETLARILDKTGIPVSTTLNGVDLIPTDHPNYVGRIGMIGERAGNFALQEADVLLTVGTRNNFRQTGFNRSEFGKNAFKIFVDIDPAELKKPGVCPDLAICCDAAIFLDFLERRLYPIEKTNWNDWRNWCRERCKRYPVVLPEYEKCENGVHPYYFVKRLSETMPADGVLIKGNATAGQVAFQAETVRQNRSFSNSGCGEMGFDLPAALGAAIGTDKTVVCLAGDGSLLMNLQELATLKHYRLPVKVFVLCNNGYFSIRQTQDAFFEKPYIACTPDSGLGMPDFEKLAKAFDLPTFVLNRHAEIDTVLAEVFAASGPTVCVVNLTPDYIYAPKTSSQKLPDGRMVSKPLDDMFPFLPLEELVQNRYIEDLLKNK
jgi:acetolactate synthase-1/2/3 large subunit